MKNLFLLSTLIFLNATLVFSQDTEASEGIYTIVEEMPAFPGGTLSFQNYLAENMQYTEAMKQDGLKGTVYVSFMVNTDGSISDAKVIRGIGGDADKEALRLINNMPTWKPGKQSGKLVKVQLQLPVRFSPPKSKTSN